MWYQKNAWKCICIYHNNKPQWQIWLKEEFSKKWFYSIWIWLKKLWYVSTLFFHFEFVKKIFLQKFFSCCAFVSNFFIHFTWHVSRLPGMFRLILFVCFFKKCCLVCLFVEKNLQKQKKRKWKIFFYQDWILVLLIFYWNSKMGTFIRNNFFDGAFDSKTKSIIINFLLWPFFCHKNRWWKRD